MHTELVKKHPGIKRYELNDHQKKKGEKIKFDLLAKDAIKVCVIISSSTGEGEPPENGEDFHKFLRK